MISDGATSFVEVGPGSVLQGLIKKVNKDIPIDGAIFWFCEKQLDQQKFTGFPQITQINAGLFEIKSDILKNWFI